MTVGGGITFLVLTLYLQLPFVLIWVTSRAAPKFVRAVSAAPTQVPFVIADSVIPGMLNLPVLRDWAVRAKIKAVT